MKQILVEGLQYLDMKNQVVPQVSIDEFKAQVGDDDEIVTLGFIVNSDLVGADLVDWFERGYEWVLDAEVSDGELANGKYVVFVEINRRQKVPYYVMELIKDLKVLTGFEADEWKIKVGDDIFSADEAEIKKHVALSPHDYREKNEGELNEWRQRAGLQPKPIFTEQDADIKAWKRRAGLE